MGTVQFNRDDFAKYTDCEEFNRIVNLETVTQLLNKAELDYAAQPAVQKEDGTVASYRELTADVRRVCGWLDANGTEKGTNLGLLCGNSYSFVAVALGIMAYGCTAVLLPAQLDDRTVFGCSKKYALNGLIYASALAEKAGLIHDVFAVSAETVLSADEGKFDETVAPDAPACILMTGGTTGRSKGAVLSHTALLCGTINGCYGLKDIFGLVYYNIIPLTHVFGFIRNLLCCLYTGGCIYFNADKRKMFDEIKECRPEVFVIVPALAELFLNLAKAYGVGVLGGRVKHIICGAASVPPYLIREYRKLGINFCPGYGLTEFSNMVSGNPEGDTKPDSVGMLFPDQEAKLVNGELWLKGRNCMTQYYAEPEENAAAFEDGWFKTGDLARFDEDGFLYIIGRIKDVIVLPNGENVSPAYIESKINELNYIQDSLVTEDRSEQGAVILQAEVVLRAAVVKTLNLEGEALEAFVKQGIVSVCDGLNDYERIGRVVIRDRDFDRTPAMKIIRPKKVFQ